MLKEEKKAIVVLQKMKKNTNKFGIGADQEEQSSFGEPIAASYSPHTTPY